MPSRWQRFAILLLTSGLAACADVPPGAGDGGSGLECNAAPDAARPQYIVGYGSLMEDASRKRTTPDAGAAHPVEIEGFSRGWFARGDATGFSATYLGIRLKSQSRINAVIYAVRPDEVLATDQRERSYCRANVAASQVSPLESGPVAPPDAQLWIYVNRPGSMAAPSPRYPIVQSYVDVFLSGCLEQESRFHLASFASECVSTTTDWSAHWVNDRLYPRRPFVFQPRARQIDELLSTHVPRHFSRIRLEPAG